ncbi:hypothetical protein, partial [Jatrophihabitans endophyticus]|uniref:hypothetical protein n=1 Tax=Jatrophihabitans endophyticus TaxID=1206085 RepID=UPI0019E616BF
MTTFVVAGLEADAGSGVEPLLDRLDRPCDVARRGLVLPSGAGVEDPFGCGEQGGVVQEALHGAACVIEDPASILNSGVNESRATERRCGELVLQLMLGALEVGAGVAEAGACRVGVGEDLRVFGVQLGGLLVCRVAEYGVHVVAVLEPGGVVVQVVGVGGEVGQVR